MRSSRIGTELSTPSGAAWDGMIKTIQTTAPESQSIVREFVSVKEAKALTGISDWTWRGWADTGVCASVKIGHRLLIPVSEIQRLLSEGLRPACKKSTEREEGGR
jgi:hypothetical protein